MSPAAAKDRHVPVLIDEVLAGLAVRDGETVMVTDGYHPFVAAHGDDAYYLNALAGDVRTMACSFDPALEHVRAGWALMDPDPRVPLVR